MKRPQSKISAINGTEYKPKSKQHLRRTAETQAYALRVRRGTGNLFGTSNTQNGDASPRGGVRLRTAIMTLIKDA